MKNEETNKIVEDIRKGTVDINNQESFYGILIKGLLLRLDDDISIRGNKVPHFILHTGDDIMYLQNKGQNNSIEPLEVSNENYIYNKVPRCIVNPAGINLITDQLTNPYTLGQLQYSDQNHTILLTGEFRRMPIKFACDIKYYVDSYTDMLELMQQITTKLAFIKTYNIVYMGQTIKCTYQIPTDFSGEYMTDIDGTTADSKYKTLSLSLEVESNMPIYSEKTIMSADQYIKDIQVNTKEI